MLLDLQSAVSFCLHPMQKSTAIVGLLMLMSLPVLPVAGQGVSLLETPAGGAARAPLPGGLENQPRPIPLKIKLPFPAGKSYKVIQGNHGDFTHTGFNEYAWDFAMPLDAEVCAAAAGRVVRVKQDGTAGGPSNEFFGDGNAIIIDHGEGYFSHYLHLAPGSARVKEGDLVTGGQTIALSGNTGFSSTPHLHFHVQDSSGKSLPVVFQDVPGEGSLAEDTMAVSQNDGTGTSQYAGESYLEPEIFKGNNIHLITRNLPGHLFRTGRDYRVRGRITGEQSRRVALYFMGPAGGKALFTIYAAVDTDGFFETWFDPATIKSKVGTWNHEPGQSNLFSLAIAPVKADGSFWSDVSVPVCIR